MTEPAQRDAAGLFVKGNKIGFAAHPENSAHGRWNANLTPSYQYKKFFNMERNKFIEIGRKWRLIEIPEGELEKYPYENHTMVEENSWLAVMRARDDLAYLKETTDRVEGRPKEKIEAKVDTRLTQMTDEELYDLARAEFGENTESKENGAGQG